LKKESNKIIKLTGLSIPIKKKINNKTKIKQIKNKYPCFLYLNFNKKKSTPFKPRIFSSWTGPGRKAPRHSVREILFMEWAWAI
jgi:hypothetical protein